MRATSLNHVSINALDLPKSVEFYVSVFGMEKIPTYTFGFPTQYLRLGDLQLHIFERPTQAPEFHHIGIDVDDLETAYLRARELGALDSTTFFSPVWELPDGSVQVYLRDPANNLVEIDWPDVARLNRAIFEELPKLADSFPQSPQADGATLYLPPRLID